MAAAVEARRRAPGVVVAAGAAAGVLRDAASGEREAGVAQRARQLGQAALDRGARRSEIGTEIDPRGGAVEADVDRHRPGLGRVEVKLGLLDAVLDEHADADAERAGEVGRIDWRGQCQRGRGGRCSGRVGAARGRADAQRRSQSIDAAVVGGRRGRRVGGPRHEVVGRELQASVGSDAQCGVAGGVDRRRARVVGCIDRCHAAGVPAAIRGCRADGGGGIALVGHGSGRVVAPGGARSGNASQRVDGQRGIGP